MARTAADLLSAIVAEAGEEELRALAVRLRPYLTDTPTRLLSAPEKGEQLGLHPDTVVRMAREGRIPGATKVGREWRFPAQQTEILSAGGASPAQAHHSSQPRRRTVERSSVAAIRGPAI
jgi:excisionase family DNA binding protein